MSCPTSWKMLLQLMLLSREPLFTMTATANRICSRTYFWRLEETRETQRCEPQRATARTTDTRWTLNRDNKAKCCVWGCSHSCSLFSLAWITWKCSLHCIFLLYSTESKQTKATRNPSSLVNSLYSRSDSLVDSTLICSTFHACAHQPRFTMSETTTPCAPVTSSGNRWYVF